MADSFRSGCVGPPTAAQSLRPAPRAPGTGLRDGGAVGPGPSAGRAPLQRDRCGRLGRHLVVARPPAFSRRALPPVRALVERRAALERLQRTGPFDFVPAAAGAERGTVVFAIDPALDGSGVAAPGATATREVPVETVDAAVAARGLAGLIVSSSTRMAMKCPCSPGPATCWRTPSCSSSRRTISPRARLPAFSRTMRLARGARLPLLRLADPMRRPRDGTLCRWTSPSRPSPVRGSPRPLRVIRRWRWRVAGANEQLVERNPAVPAQAFGVNRQVGRPKNQARQPVPPRRPRATRASCASTRERSAIIAPDSG